MLSTIWETEGLQTVGIVVLVIASIKLLHLLGLISFSEGKTPAADALILQRGFTLTDARQQETCARRIRSLRSCVFDPAGVGSGLVGPGRAGVVAPCSAVLATRLFYKHAALSIRMIDQEKLSR